jgi:ferrochelatase
MKYRGNPDFDHGTRPRVGVLLTNLGTPDAATKQALRPYLKQFLWDPRVVEIPRAIWWLILNGIILNVRPARSAEAYSEVWTERGSPLLYHLEDQVSGVRERLAKQYGEDVVVRGAMRYGNPSIPSVLQEMFDAGVQRLVVLPLYPQYAGATTGSTFDEIASDFQQRRWLPDLRFVSSYHDDMGYIDAIANSVTRHWEEHGRADKLVFSYHGTPKRYLMNGDPYHCQCHKTTRLVAEKLGLDNDQFLTTFQSRFGREEWLKPYTDETLKALPAQGVSSLQIICPGFSADCLETIEEIGMENRDYFMEAGGERYEYIPCLNAEAEHLDLLTAMVEREMQGWTDLRYEPEACKANALALGAQR